MACSPSPVASKCWNDASLKWGSRVTYLGIVGDQAHQVRVSGHNCGSLQESSLTHPDTGVLWSYPDEYAHALDIGHGGNRALASEIRNALLTDPFKRVRYVIDNGVIYYPAWRGGGTSSGSGHSSHVHVSFTPWSTHDVRNFFGPTPNPIFPMQRGDHGFGVLVVEIALVRLGYADVVVDGRYGPQTVKAVKDIKQFLHRGNSGSLTEADFEAITGWLHMVGPGSVWTLTSRGPGVASLRSDLLKIGQDVPRVGNVYDARIQKAVQNVQRFFDSSHKAGNASADDRKFIHELAQEAD